MDACAFRCPQLKRNIVRVIDKRCRRYDPKARGVACRRPGVAQGFFNRFNPLLADFVGLDRLRHDGEQVVDVGFALLAQRLGMALEHAISFSSVRLNAAW